DVYKGQVQGLGKAFALKSGRLQALQSVDLKARAGEVTALAGSDGAGKTTLIRVLAGLLAPDAGTVSALGYDVARETQAVQSRIGLSLIPI
ncbi:ATP-binding cassette domain-containing protein, partial [Leclercia adecarboxylata]|uniref:ATP-binding cassette domain-containing protein n=1 Tax=Leclercia adecarboxylata TaxID=83655 RepID=UPI00234D6074